uniref:Uncharacterized protein n=1 Tax=Physcomitrium patens TaxID=3218 RepID=A0A2K1KQD7_PHYPA|nr:hypothetical protein PHYPA_006863 [Physcomitrium patens]
MGPGLILRFTLTFQSDFRTGSPLKNLSHVEFSAVKLFNPAPIQQTNGCWMRRTRLPGTTTTRWKRSTDLMHFDSSPATRNLIS